MKFRHILIAALVPILVGCWEQPGFDPGRSNASSLPTPIVADNVGRLVRAFGAPAGGPSAPNIAVSGGTLYAGTDRLSAFDASGNTGCAGSPRQCSPRWRSGTSDPQVNGWVGGPAVGAGKVWSLFHYGGIGFKLQAFDAAGASGCHGSPTICDPVVEVVPPVNQAFATAITLGPAGPYLTSTALSRGIARPGVTSFAQDGSFRWTTAIETLGARTAIAGNTLYASLPDEAVGAFDADGNGPCLPSAGLVFCYPLWTTRDAAASGFVAVRDGRLFVHGLGSAVTVYDAAGKQGCSGIPNVCTPLWTTSNADTFGMAISADRLVTSGPSGVHAYSLSGASCSGSPVVCHPLWTGSVPPGVNQTSDPTIAGGVVYTAFRGTANGVATHDLAGSVGCSGIPVTCSSLWSPVTTKPVDSPIVVAGLLYLVDQSSLSVDVTAYRLP